MGGLKSQPLRALRQPWIWVLALYLALMMYAAVPTWLHSHDDAYITYTFAKNLAAGNGLTWNGGEGLGTTSPLLATILGTAERLWPLSIPMWGNLLAWLAIFATACCLYALGRGEGWPTAGWVAGAGWLVSPATVEFLGGEYPMAVAMISGAAIACQRRNRLGVALCLALAVGLRNEMAIAAVLLAIAVWWRDGWRSTLQWFAPAAAGAMALWGCWLVCLWWLTGTALPASLAAKRAQAESVFGFWHGGAKFLKDTLYTAETVFFSAGFNLAVSLLCVGLAGVIYSHWRGRPRPFAMALVLWGVLHIAALTALNIPFYPWYAVPLHFSATLLIGMAAEWSLPRGKEWRLAKIFTASVALAITCFLLVNGQRNLKRHRNGPEDRREVSYGRLAEWIGERYPPSTRLASFEVGYLGFHGPFQTLDLLGLTTPQTPLEAVRRGDFAAVLEELDPDLLILPVPFVELTRALVGKQAELVSNYRLEYQQLGLWPPLLLYRRHDVESRGEIVDDLMALARQRGDSGLVFRAKGRRGAPVLMLKPGERSRFELENPRQGQRFETRLATPTPPVTAYLRVSDADGNDRLSEELRHEKPHWQRWRVTLPNSTAGLSLELECAAESAAPCWFVTPHIRR